jgi:hypothetical protein
MITITINEKEILQNPNNESLGEYVRKKFEHEVFLKNNSYDKCIICGKETPYLKSTHLNDRVGYVEGSGQGCYQPNTCDKI